MNDLYILNGTKTIIYAVCLYDYKEEKIVLFQVSINNIISKMTIQKSPNLNYRWIKVQIKNQIQTFFYHKQKNGFSLYNSFIDLYVNQKTKVVLCLIDSIILSIFYSSSTDFYYLGPYLLNLISSIKFVCNSKEFTNKIINENFLDINTMICDLIGFFNGFTRALCQDYNCYLGCDAIYNERCFLHLRKNNNDSILVMCREHSGANDYFQEKSIQQIKPKFKNNKIGESGVGVEIKNRNILMFMKFKKNEKKREYLTYDYNSYKNKKYDYEEEHKINNKGDLLDKSVITNNLDFPSESQLFDENEININDNIINNKNENEYESKQIGEVFDFINNMINNTDEKKYDYNQNKEKKKIQLSKSYNFKKESNYESQNNYKKFKQMKSNEIKNNFSEINNNNQSSENIHNFFRYKTINFDKRITLKNMELIKSINFDDLINNDIDEHIMEINKEQNQNYENIQQNSLMNNFYQINNNYIDEEINQVFNENTKYINNNNLNEQIYNKNNNIYYPSQEINTNMNNNSQSIIPYIPQINFNNSNNNFTAIYYNNSNNIFSQNDLSFLNGYSKMNNQKEDLIKINKNNPEIISELKEKIYYYHSLSQDNNTLINISLKGYIGINIKPPNIINNKEFYINFFSEKWKDYNYFTNRDLNKNIEQITENIYKICLKKQQNTIKLITYSINKNIVEKINLIRVEIKIFKNILAYRFNSENKIINSIKNIEIIIEYKNNCPNINNISTDGKILGNNNLKTNIIYKNYINEGKILFPINNIYLYMKKLNIQIILKNTLLSDMNCKISFSNSANQSQESLPCRKISLISFQYE